MTDSQQLLADYRQHGSDAAFRELVSRFVGLVYSTALRLVGGDTHQAEDVTQTVFVDLARLARTLPSEVRLGGWLHRHTCFVAANTLRGERRRQARERQAVEMNALQNHSEADFSQVAPLLDEAINELAEADRTAILLRFFEQQEFRAVGAALGSTEDAARMRVTRALEKLEDFLKRRGVTTSAASLGVVLTANAVQAAPVGLAVTISTAAALAGTTFAATATATATKAIEVVSRLRVGATVALGVAIVGLIWFGLDTVLSGKKATEASLDQNSAPVENTTPVQPVAAAIQPATYGRKFRLTVLDEATGVPLVGAKVTVSNLGRPLGEGVTDWEGHCDLPQLTNAGKDFYFKLRTEYDGYASMNVSWSRFQRDEPEDIPETFELKMPRGTRVGGVVTDGNGHPLQGIPLRIQSRYRRGGPPPRTRPLLNDGSFELTTSDLEGRWSFDRLPPDWDDVVFRLRSPDFLPAEYVCDANRHPITSQVTIPKADLLALRALIVLRHGPLISGLVLDQNQNPISGVRVVQNSNWSDEYASSKTGTDGVYRIQNVSTGALTLSFQAENYSPQTASFVIDGPATNAPVVLAPGHPLRGRVLDPTGQPLEGVTVDTGQGGDPNQQFQWRTKTDGSGSFVWNGAPETPVNLAFTKLGFRQARVPITANGNEQTVTLERMEESGAGIRIQGEVLDAATGQPIPAFKFSLKENRDQSVVAKEGMAGKFSVRSDGSSNPVGLEVQAEGYEAAESELLATTNGDQTVVFHLRRSEGWNGLVLLPTGQPAVDAEVVICGPMKGAILGKRRLLFRDQSTYQLTDSAGRFHFDPVKDARMIVAIHQEGYEERALDQLAANPSVRLRPWGRVEGVLRSAGPPLPNQRVLIAKRFWNPWIPAVLLYADVFAVTTDANGAFVFSDVPPGDHALGHFCVGRSTEVRATVRVNPGETATVEVGGDGRPITGKIHVSKVETGFSFSHSRGVLKAVMTQPVDLENLARRNNFPSDEAYQEAAKLDAARRTAYWQSAEGLAIWRRARSYAVWFDADGTFHADDVPAGNYELSVFLEVPVEGKRFPETRSAGMFKAAVVIPAAATSNSDQPANVGDVELQDRWP